MLLSIIIPIYNGEKTLPSLLNPILEIERKDVEVILVDDGSKDGSYTLCKEYAARDNRVISFHIENSGVSAARNKGLDNATGKYIYFCDCDDYVFIKTLNLILPILAENDFDLITADYIYKFLDTGKTVENITNLPTMRPLSKSEIVEYLITPLVLKSGTGLASLWNKFFLSSKIKENGLRFNNKIHRGEDWQFIMKFLEFSNSAYYLPKILYEYRIDGSQTESKYKKEAGVHLLYSQEIKVTLAKEFNIEVDKDTCIIWWTDIFEELVFSANSDISYGEWQKIADDRLVLLAAKKLFFLKSKDYFKYEISRKYKVFSLFIMLGSKKLLRLLIKSLNQLRD